MDWHTRITQARTAKNLKKTDLARLVGVSPATITMWESGQTKKIEGANLMKVCEVLDINPAWLLGKIGQADDAFKQAWNDMSSRSVSEVRIVRVHPGPDPQTYEVEDEYEFGIPSRMGLRAQWLMSNNLTTSDLIAIKVRSSDMEPSLSDGDVALVHTVDTHIKDGMVYAVFYEGTLLIRRLTRDAGEWWLTADHADQRRYGKKIFRHDIASIVGRIILKETERI